MKLEFVRFAVCLRLDTTNDTLLRTDVDACSMESPLSASFVALPDLISAKVDAHDLLLTLSLRVTHLTTKVRSSSDAGPI